MVGRIEALGLTLEKTEALRFHGPSAPQRLHSGQHGPPNGSGPDEVTGPYYIHIVIMHILYNVHFIALYDVIINSVFIKSKSFIIISGW